MEVHWPLEKKWFKGRIDDINLEHRQFKVYYFVDRRREWHPEEMEVKPLS